MSEDVYNIVKGARGNAVKIIDYHGKRYYDVHEAAAFLQVSRGLVNIWLKEGSLEECIKDNWYRRRVYIPESLLIKMKEDRIIPIR